MGIASLGGATLAKGYRNTVEPDPFAEPGWFRTDDIGVVDDSGVLSVLGRIDDAISTGGLTVMPQPVEAALRTHPAVADCAVFGLADERLGQRVAAAVVVADGCEAPSLDALRAHVMRTLDHTAAPREMHIVDALPMRGQIREFAAETASPMPSFVGKLTENEIADLLAYLVSLRGL